MRRIISGVSCGRFQAFSPESANLRITSTHGELQAHFRQSAAAGQTLGSCACTLNKITLLLMQPMVRERNHELIWRDRNEEACMMEQKSHSRGFGSMLIAMILLGGVPP